MKKNSKYILLFIVSVFTHSVFAGSLKTDNPVRERSNKEAMTETVYKKFVKLQEMIADSKYVAARTGLNALLNKRLNSFEKAQIHQFLAWVDSAEDKFTSASKHLQIAIDSDALPNIAQFNMMLQMAQMLAGAGKYQQAIDALHRYYKVTDEIQDTTFNFEAQLYAQLDKFKPAIVVLKKAIDLADKPKEPWHYLLFNLHMQLSEFSQAAAALEVLIKINPNKRDYWVKLSQVYFTLQKDDKALATLVVADKNGMIPDEKDRLQLVKMYAFMGVPYKAGKVLEQGLKSGAIKPTFKRWDDLGSMWYSAAEMDNALRAYDEASKLATDGQIDYRRANIYFSREKWNKAKNALLAAIEKGGLNDRKLGTSWLLIGMAESEQGNDAAAIKYLRNALQYKSSKKHAAQWIEHLQSKLKAAQNKVAAEKALAEETAANAIAEQ
ncbi:hypothetical protein MNBD_GAMMA01-1932 [hydrothermal vent metagenome]|uniref:TPR domain protein, component of TonB system n=1 Tax=hydrothermal vent metagenome TaxID=652676 RepID=A0A3B0VAV0_9ZZZZ